MKYIAHAGVKLKDGITTHKSSEWQDIKNLNGVKYRWRFHNDKTYEVVAGLFESPQDALECAKRMYVTLLYSLLRGGFSLAISGCTTYEPRMFNKERDMEYKSFIENEGFFFWNKHLSGGRYGPGVYEVEDSFDEFEEYKFLNFELSISYDSNLHFSNVDEYIFIYNRKAQELLNSVIVADNEMDYGMKMTIYCSILEHLSESEKKSDAVQCEIDSLVKAVKTGPLLTDEKEQLINYLNLGRELSARQKCIKLIKKYAAQKYAQYSAKDILSEAYRIRSAFSHGDNIDSDKIESSYLIKRMVLDVIEGYMRDLEV